MSTLSDTDHTLLRTAEQTWLLHSADRLRRAATDRRTAPARSTGTDLDSKERSA